MAAANREVEFSATVGEDGSWEVQLVGHGTPGITLQSANLPIDHIRLTFDLMSTGEVRILGGVNPADPTIRT